MKKLRVQDGKGLFELAEAAVHQVRLAPLSVLTPYFIGTAPFLLAFLYFWADMMQGAYAWRYTGPAAFGVALAFVWMKCWHAVYCFRMRAMLAGGATGHWSFARAARLIATQTIIHAAGFVLLPLAMLTVIPFGHLYAFFQNAAVFGADEDNRVTDVVRRAWTEARRWPGQNWKILWLLSPLPLLLAAGIQLVLLPVFRTITPDWSMMYTYVYLGILTVLAIPLSPIGTLLTFNVYMLITFIPQMLQSLLGIETVMSLGGDSGNSALYAVCVGTAFLCMDPVMKAAYTLRCFHGESVTTGEDLRVALGSVTATRNVRAGLLLLFGTAALFCAPAFAQEPEIPEARPANVADQLDEAISQTLEQREYAWRFPKQIPDDAFEDNFLSLFLQSILVSVGEMFKAIGRAIEWFFNLFQGGGSTMDVGFGWETATRILWIIVLGGVLFALLLIIWRILKQRKIALVQSVATPVVAVPNVEEEDVTADALPEDGWLALARELMERGEYRLAMRALFLATLAVLAHRDLIRIAKYKSNREYLREIERHGHSVPEMPPAFAESVNTFERVWYGRHALDRFGLDVFNTRQERIRGIAKLH
ncbi:MAG: DUF4129 domain-containing protein [Candidatus Hydrogenedentes bacterium]|nr:DUF4129 domain-containing protein [Candidatus Hydrogenedentota bacterium]